MSGRRKVAVTGVGVISPIGCDKEAFFDSLANARSGVGKISAAFARQLGATVAAQVSSGASSSLSKAKSVSLDRFSQFAMLAGGQAIRDAGLETERLEQAGVYLGSSMGGSGTLEEAYTALFRENASRLRPMTVLMVMPNAAASHIAMEYRLKGPVVTFSVACASSAIAIGEAYRLIRDGYADVMLAGGSEAMLSFGVIKAWESLGALAKEWAGDPAASCRPFSGDRSGLVLGEGGAVFVLEEFEAAIGRGAQVYAEVIGYASNCDAGHITKPDVRGQRDVMRGALRDAGVAPEEINYINAHGSATLVGDRIETTAIREVFGKAAERIPVSSTKSMHGHLLGAAGAVEFLAALFAIKTGVIPPTVNLQAADPECDLDYVPNMARAGQDVKIAMSNSFAFGGSNASLIARRI